MRKNKNASSKPMGRPIEKPKNFKAAFSRLIGYYFKNKVLLFLVGILVILSTFFTVIAPEILGNITTMLYNGVKSGVFVWDSIVNTIVTLAFIYVTAQVLRISYSFIMAKVNAKTIYELRQEVSVKINKLPLKYFDSKTHGELISRVTNDMETINSSIQQGFVQLLNSIATVIGILVMMFVINVYMALVAIVVIPISFYASSFAIKKSQKHFVGQQKYIGELNGHIEEMYAAHNVVKVYNYEEQSIEKFNHINEKIENHTKNANFLSGLIMPIVSLFGNLGYVAVVAIGSVFAMNGSIEVGQIQAFVQYMRQFMQPLNTISNMASSLQSTVAAAERVFELLDEQEEVKDSEKAVEVKKLNGNVEFKNIAFGYVQDVPVIKNLSISVKNGQTVAIVGHTGAGKTTLINLLMRFYDVDSGEILIDGINIKDIAREDLHTLFGLVLQDTWLFHGTILENLAYGKIGASEKEITKAAKIAECHHFISTLPDGYNMVINEEANNLSQGQKQLLTIARAMVANPKILVLDEATSSVDTLTEARIQKAIKNLMKNRTSFVIAHRLSTIKGADLILVMENGDVVETGTHSELMANKGKYAKLYNSQFEKVENLDA